MDASEEIQKVFALLNAKNIGASKYESATYNSYYVLGGFGPLQTAGGIPVFTGLTFTVRIFEEKVEASVAWPGQLSTHIECTTAEQAVSWLIRMNEMISKEK